LFDLSYPAGWTTPLCRHEAGACSGARTTRGRWSGWPAQVGEGRSSRRRSAGRGGHCEQGRRPEGSPRSASL